LKNTVRVVAVVGLGYVGLPLAVKFGNAMHTIGFDLSEEKIAHYRKFHDPTDAVSEVNLRAATHLKVTTDVSELKLADIIDYLIYQAEKFGHHPEVILSGRRINDSMGAYVAEQTIKTMVRTFGKLTASNGNILGMTFKEDCPDLRNTKVIDFVNELKAYGQSVLIHDPHANSHECVKHYQTPLTAWEDLPMAEVPVPAVAHKAYLSLPLEKLLSTVRPGGVVIDVKSALNRDAVAAHGLTLWPL